MATRPDAHLSSADPSDGSCEAVYVTDTRRRILSWNEAAEQITGFTGREVVGHRCSGNILVHVDGAGRSLCLGLCPLAATIADGTPRSTEAYLHHKRGHRMRVRISVEPVLDEDGNVIGGVERFVPMSETHTRAALLADLSRPEAFDTISGRSERGRLISECETRLAAVTGSGATFGLLLVGLDDFSVFVSDYGDEIAELAQETIADTLAACVQPVDFVAHWEDAVFAVLLADASADSMAHEADRLRNLVRTSRIHAAARLDGIPDRTGHEPIPRTIRVTASVGGALARAGDDVASLVERATSDLLAIQGATLPGLSRPGRAVHS